jgi:hypothetical protein
MSGSARTAFRVARMSCGRFAVFDIMAHGWHGATKDVVPA